MNQASKLKAFSLLQRETQEFRNSFLITPAVIAGLLILLMLGSVLFANRIAFFGNSMMEVLTHEHAGGGMNITISIDDDTPEQDYVITDEKVSESEQKEDWNFSHEWTFSPEMKEKAPVGQVHDELESLNPVLNVLHAMFLLVMLLVSINYLLGSLHADRRDRSVLFWKSMPVSEWQEVAAKMVTVSLIVPGAYIAISILTQLAFVILAMLLAWRMDMDPNDVVLNNINFVSLFLGQLSGWLVWVLWTAPFYAWLLLSSAAARRSPLMLALAVPIGLVVVTRVFLGSSILLDAISNHIPHMTEESASSMGFYLGAPDFMTLDYLGMLGGLVITAALLAGAVWLRKHRFEM